MLFFANKTKSMLNESKQYMKKYSYLKETKYIKHMKRRETLCLHIQK